MTKISTFLKLLIGLSISDREFKDLIRPIAARNSHYLFELILKKYDPSLNLNYSKLYPKKDFINEGRGAGILKPNRILSRSSAKVFEKVFFNHSPGLSRNLMFSEMAQDNFMKDQIIYPAIEEIIKGEKFTIILFEFLDLKRIPSGTEYEKLKATTYNMLRCQQDALTSDEIHYDRFIIGKKRLIETNVFSNDEILKLEAIVKSAPVYFQHFDLKEDNVFLGNVIIDWDNSGNYHLGADFGVLLLSFFVFNEPEFFKLYKEEIREYYQQVNADISYDTFYLTVLYYFLNLFHGYSAGEAHFHKILPVIQDCKSKLEDI